MNGTLESINTLVSEIVEGLPEGPDVAVFPPHVYLTQVVQHLKDAGINVGAQNVDWHEAGAFTGEVSAGMIKDIGCSLSLVGHSERRWASGGSWVPHSARRGER